MTVKPSYEDLENRIKKLEKEVVNGNQVKEAFRRREAILEAVGFVAKELLTAGTQDQDIQAVIQWLGKATKVSRIVIFKNHIGDDNEILIDQLFEWVSSDIRSQIKIDKIQNYSFQARGLGRWETALSRGEFISGHIRDFPLSEQKELGSMGIKSLTAVPIFVGEEWWGLIGFDERKAEREWSVGEIEALRTAAGALGAGIHRRRADEKLKTREEELEVKSSSLEEVNTALRVLLKRRDEDKTELEEKVLRNVKELVLPYLEKLAKSGLNRRQEGYVSILESNLRDIISPFTTRLSSTYINLTPTELEVANLIKQGRSTKGTAQFLNLSIKTIEGHRDNIRRKLGIKNKKVNLRTHLLTIQ